MPGSNTCQRRKKAAALRAAQLRKRRQKAAAVAARLEVKGLGNREAEFFPQALARQCFDRGVPIPHSGGE